MTLFALQYMGAGEFQARHPHLADRTLVIGEILNWEQVDVDARSGRSHRHYFACINNAWKNLPEELVDELPNPEALRKYALIKAGYARRTEIVCANNGEAMKVATFARDGDEFCIVVVENKVVKIWRAQSQKMRAMGREEFQLSKDSVLDVVSRLIGTDAAELKRSTPE